MLTKNDLLKIERYFKKATKKDTDFALIDGEHIDANTELPVIHNNENKIINLQDFFSSEVSRYLITKVRQDFDNLTTELSNTLDHLNKVIRDIEQKTGVALGFGSSESVSVSQNILTDTINKMWKELEEATGKTYLGFNVSINKDSFVSIGPRKVQISITSNGAGVRFEQINIFADQIDDEHLVLSQSNIETLSEEIEINKTTNFIVSAQILGVTYREEKLITHYDALWVGAGNDSNSNYESVVSDIENARALDNGLSISTEANIYDSSNNHIVIVMADNISKDFIRADLFGIEIPMVKRTVRATNLNSEVKEMIGDQDLIVYTSVNAYEIGTYNIKINM